MSQTPAAQTADLPGTLTAPAAPALAADAVGRHSVAEDALAIVCGTLLVALGLSMFNHGALVPGSTAGIATLLHQATGLSFGLVFFVINLPFCALAWWQLGRAFTIKSFAAVASLSLLSQITSGALQFAVLQPLYGAVAGGVVLGMGFLVLFRHRASLGGVGVLAAWLQHSRGWRAGHVQMAVDLLVLAGALVSTDAVRVAWSVLGALVMNGVLAINHRPGRYMAT